ncbi:ABC transporter ATP-binding protein [Phytohabitans aurantiacus]|jgi:peptide/nickel transport system ATP-binding protein|uniref:Dipeptide/oligopeptide/nickel ABC transporter ATP-binding protein n=1 Tax=Phytohabitans aurantiacus TaxID=3016789 RepID=A0ABQ5R5F1_9ACTN|nr:ABC transporter ATP-binding protein [Phytohabitans aurantiacus]GLI01793.1 dipeptide/oligopeptide/nickel ABC transporter ATP-binding protein [Phytohabitans aurantiacus]
MPAETTLPGDSLLSVRDLRVQFPTDDGIVRSVDGLSFDVAPGEIVGVVGESGSGKSVTGQAILGLLRRTRARVTGEIRFDGRDLVAAPEAELRRLRGAELAMVFQDPLSALHPYYTVGSQVSEAYRVHNRVSKRAARERATQMLDRVGIPEPHRRYDAYPHEFSGGMRQRVMIAMALVCTPRLLIADEPTTALDVTVQAQILELLKDLRDEFGSAVLLVTHDLGVVAETCDSVVVMYAGQCVEQAGVEDLFARPQAPYTWGLLGSMPRVDQDRRDRLAPIGGQPPSLLAMPPGCAFEPRCGYHEEVPDGRCRTERPALVHSGDGHSVRCHLTTGQRLTLRPVTS